MPRRPTAADAAAHQPLISDQNLKHLYATLLRCRLLRQRHRSVQGGAPPVACESIVTGTVTHLTDADTVVPAAGDRLAALALGHNLRRILAGAALPGVLPGAPPAEARFAIAAGYAMAQSAKNNALVTFSGPGVTTLEPLRAALAYAAQHKLGVVFVIETAASADISSARHTDPLGLYGIPVDGNDVVAVYRVAQEAITRARRGLGPTLIDCKPWPLSGNADPVRRLEEALQRRGLTTATLKEQTIAAFKKKWSEATASRRKR